MSKLDKKSVTKRKYRIMKVHLPDTCATSEPFKMSFGEQFTSLISSSIGLLHTRTFR